MTARWETRLVEHPDLVSCECGRHGDDGCYCYTAAQEAYDDVLDDGFEPIAMDNTMVLFRRRLDSRTFGTGEDNGTS